MSYVAMALSLRGGGLRLGRTAAPDGGQNLPVREVWPIVFVEGTRAGVALGACVVVLAFLGLSPTLRWIPDVPLLVAAVLLPVAAFSLTGHRAGKRSGRTIAGALAGGVAGRLGGRAPRVAYRRFRKPALNGGVRLLPCAAGGG